MPLYRKVFVGLMIFYVIGGYSIVVSTPPRFDRFDLQDQCVKKPKNENRSVYANCTTDYFCEDLLGTLEGYPYCGYHGECVTTSRPQYEYCLQACSTTPCAKLCLQVHESIGAMYCVQTRDHPNALPTAVERPPNKYVCACQVPAKRLWIIDRLL